MAKNPFLSAYLTAANRVVNTARGKAMNEGRRQVRRQNSSAVNAWFDAASPSRRPRRKRRG
jgi:antibiotic biosynthesis monooxygenase (ABM) superfamily enzyme